jgi:hypothetical protein
MMPAARAGMRKLRVNRGSSAKVRTVCGGDHAVAFRLSHPPISGPSREPSTPPEWCPAKSQRQAHVLASPQNRQWAPAHDPKCPGRHFQARGRSHVHGAKPQILPLSGREAVARRLAWQALERFAEEAFRRRFAQTNWSPRDVPGSPASEVARHPVSTQGCCARRSPAHGRPHA